jgi:hypothetical protein
MCIRGINFASLYDFLLDFGTVLTVWYFGFGTVLTVWYFGFGTVLTVWYFGFSVY